LAFVATAKGASVFEAFAKSNSEKYPKYIEEIRGTAKGCGVSFDTLLVSNLRQELQAFMPESEKAADVPTAAPGPAVTHCTDVMVHAPAFGNSVLGHNEDGDWCHRTGYFMKATFTDVSPSYSFTSFTYPGQLSGACYGFNDAGLLHSGNQLYPLGASLGGLGIQFVMRDAVAATSFDDHIRRVGVPNQAMGTHYWLISLRERRMASIETAMSKVDVYNVPAGTTYAHMNSYRRLKIKEDCGEGSRHRLAAYERIAAVKTPTTLADVLAVLGDNSDAKLPVFRDENYDYGCLNTGVFLMPSPERRVGVLRVWTSNPKHNSRAFFDIPLPNVPA